MDKKEALARMQRLKILFVDDEENVLTTMTALLADMNINYLTAVNGKDALDKIKLNPDIDLIVSDYHMPNMTGMQMLEVLREEGNDVAFIFISGHQSMELFDKADDLGALEYLYKPFDFSEFVDLVGQLDIK